MDKKYCIICDIDNVFVDSREWVKEITPDCKSREDWDIFQSKMYLSKPNQPVIDLMLSVYELITVMFLTSRENRKNHRQETIKQIENFTDGKMIIGENCHLIMRNEFDYRPSAEVKKEQVAQVVSQGYIPILAIDDDESNCLMFKELGIPCNRYHIETGEMEKIYVVSDY